MGKKSQPATPPPPKPTDPATPISLDFLLGNVNTENPTGRTELGGYDDEGNWRAISQEDRMRAFATAFSDPTKPNWAALAPILAAERRSIEDPRLRAIRERDQETQNLRQQIGGSYLSQFGVTPTALPSSQYGLPEGGSQSATLPTPTAPNGMIPQLPGVNFGAMVRPPTTPFVRPEFTPPPPLKFPGAP